jgi:hypothetical protein
MRDLIASLLYKVAWHCFDRGIKIFDANEDDPRVIDWYDWGRRLMIKADNI